MSEELIHIDELIGICGHSESETGAGGGYGCDHPDCNETEFIEIKNGEYNRWFNERGKMKEAVKKGMILGKTCGEVESEFHELSEKDLKKLNLKKCGKCFAWSCPLAYQADSKDMRRLGDDDLANQYKGESGVDSHWLVYENLKKKQ